MQVGREYYADLDVCGLLPRGFAHHKRMLPLLIHLGGLEQKRRIELLDRTHDWARGHHMPFFSALFTSGCSPGQTKVMLVDQMVCRRPDGVRAWLRYHDPRVFRHLHWLLDQEQLATLMGPATTWLGFDPLCRQWHRWSRPGVPGSRRLYLSPEQWQAVEQFEPLNRCLRDLAELGLPTDDEVSRRVLERLLEARRQGLVRDVDAIRFALGHQSGRSSTSAG